MKAGKFINKYLSTLARRHESGGPGEERKKTSRRATMAELLRLAHERYLADYYHGRGSGKKLATTLRWLGFAGDIAGTYLFWTLGGAGFGFKFAALLIKTVADGLDAVAYQRHRKALKKKNVRPPRARIAAEGLLERVLAYLPYGVGEVLDLARGRRKFDEPLNRIAFQQAENAYRHTRAEKP
jgi:hypothetical protein